MRRTALVILGIAGGLVALILVGVAIAVATVDPTRFVAPLAERVKAETGRTLTVQGPVRFKLSLEPKVELPGVAFENAPWSKTHDMLTAKRIEAQVALLPLLSRRFEVTRFVLVEPVITLETDAGGRGNWELAPAAGSGPAQAAGASGPMSGTTFGIGNFEIDRGTLTYRNGATGKTTVAAIDRMSMHGHDLAKPVAIDFRGTIDDVPVALSGDLGPPSQWLAQQWPYPVALKGAVDGNDVKFTTKLAKAGTSTTLDDLAIAYGPLAATGRIRTIAEGPKTRYVIELTIPSLSLADLPGTVKSARAGAPPPVAAPAPSAAHWVIPDAPLTLPPLAGFDGEGTLSIGELKLRDGQRISGVTAQFAARDTRLDVTFGAESILGGSIRGQIGVDAARADAPGIRVKLDARDLDLPKLAAAADIKREIQGGKVRADIDITGRGFTPHRIASTLNGTILLVSGPATLGRAAAPGNSAASQVASAFDPLRNVEAATELKCAVVRLPVADGVARVDRSIAIETGKLVGSASGTIDFRDETLDLAVQPQLRQGVNVDVSQIASLVRVRGRFDKPSVGIDAAQTAQLIAKMAPLAAKGGGLAALGALLVAPAGDAGAPCTLALSGKAPPATSQPRTAEKQANEPRLPKDLGKALDQLLKR
jgi:AsmA family protein